MDCADDRIDTTRLCRQSAETRLIASTTSGLRGPSGEVVE